MKFRIANVLSALCLFCGMASAEDQKAPAQPLLKVPPAAFAGIGDVNGFLSQCFRQVFQGCFFFAA